MDITCLIIVSLSRIIMHVVVVLFVRNNILTKFYYLQKTFSENKIC